MDPQWSDQLHLDYQESIPAKLAEIRRLLDDLQSRPESRERLESLCQLLHRIRGSAGTYGFDDLGRFAAKWEDQFRARLRSTAPPTPDDFAGLRQALDERAGGST